MTNNNKYDVALSFAGEQREYVDSVAHLIQSYGYVVFYDEFHKAKLWGKDLAAYFKEVYFSDSDKVIMFISKEYVSKFWPSYERKHALAKSLIVKDEYILPVRFDDTEVPGLPEKIGYLDAQKESPEDIAKLFLEKIESES